MDGKCVRVWLGKEYICGGVGGIVGGDGSEYGGGKNIIDDIDEGGFGGSCGGFSGVLSFVS